MYILEKSLSKEAEELVCGYFETFGNGEFVNGHSLWTFINEYFDDKANISFATTNDSSRVVELCIRCSKAGVQWVLNSVGVELWVDDVRVVTRGLTLTADSKMFLLRTILR